jgi:hypothetical protein
MSNIQQDMIEQTLAILASMMQQAAQCRRRCCAAMYARTRAPTRARAGANHALWLALAATTPLPPSGGVVTTPL